MSLAEYKKKRSFTKTPEPEGKQTKPSGSQLIFVVQKHHASSLHYDFRLELKGTLKSWAVPKGPSLNPADKRLAMLVEDHPFDYKDFEGIIPTGNYGAGTVIIWDRGTYESAESAATKGEQEKMLLKGFFSGSLRIKLKGKKLKGEFALVRSKGREDNVWFLIKKNDQHSGTTDITLKDKSVVSGKTLEEVKNNKQSKKWISNRTADGKIKNTAPEPSAKEPSTKTITGEEANLQETADKNYAGIIKQIMVSLKGKKKTALPGDLKPMLATLTTDPFDDPEWMYEVKWDGYRALAYLNKGKVELRSRNNNVFNEKFFPVYKAMKLWPVKAVVDGEVVVINKQGHSRFTDIQNWRSEADGELVFYVFDILWLNGIELINLPLTERRDLLRQIVPPQGIIKMSENFETSCNEFLAVAQKMGLEGIIAKKADSVYVPNTRTKLWLKIKTEQRHEAIIAGYTKNKDSPKKFSALILGVYENSVLKFIGQAGTGFTNKMQTQILKKLKPLATKECPFSVIPAVSKLTRFNRSALKPAITWVKPELVCAVRYQELTSEAIMRHPSFQGLREDKEAGEVIKEVAVPAPGTITQKELAPKQNALKPVKHKERKTFLNPSDETQIKTINGHPLTLTNLNKIYSTLR